MPKNKGFTLVELLITIAIIGALTSVIVPALSGAREKALDARRVAEANNIMKALEQYYLDNDEYPDDGVDDDEVVFSDLAADLIPEYMGEIPLDPNAGDTVDGYKYCATDDQLGYYLRIPLADDGDAATTPYCGYQRGSEADTACPNAALDDLCIDRI